ncbi:MAG: PhzF family phenazine biosynthesis protein [Alphaproteobacteria bacterium]|nr:PhzF family phenazine biosynthesis protein [Alphaproteobacteria bacterium]
MANYKFRIVNVFAETKFGGNPLCVFEDARGIDKETMLALARQFNLSETTFLQPSELADAKVFIFTPDHEMRFAGHPTIGSAYVVQDLLNKGTELKLELGIGIIPLTLVKQKWTLKVPPFVEPVIRETNIADSIIAKMLGLNEIDLLDKPVWVDTGSDQLLIPLKTVESVFRASPVSELSREWPKSKLNRQCAYIFAFDEKEKKPNKIIARFFFHTDQGGINEDPATGSACANLGAWLLKTKRIGSGNFQIVQGKVIKRSSYLSLNVLQNQEIYVGGHVIEIGRGSINI